MNEKFFSLPEEKQQAIINAGYRVFSRNSYNKSPMQEIADAAGISKSLLFHYFQNKKDLYMFLWERCAVKTIEYMTKYRCYEQKDLFECMYRGMQAKIISYARVSGYGGLWLSRRFTKKILRYIRLCMKATVNISI